MIFLHVILLIVVIVPTKQSGVPTTYRKESKVDWTQCEKDCVTTPCYKEALCYCEKGTSLQLDYARNVRKPPDGEQGDGVCDIGMHSKYFNFESALFQMQIMGKNLENSLKLKLLQGSKFVFGCNFKDGKAQLEIGGDGSENDNKWFPKFKISLFEDLSRIEKGNVLCAIRVGRADKLYKYMYDNHESGKTIMNLITSNADVKYEKPNSGSDWFLSTKDALKKPACNPDSFKDLKRSSLFHVLPVQNKHTSKIDCRNYNESYSFKYLIPGNETIYDAQELQCVVENNKYYFTIVKNAPAPASVSAAAAATAPERLMPGKYTFFCGAEFNELCYDPMNRVDCPSNNPDCPQYTPGSKNTPAKLTCTDNKWIINKVYLQLTAEPVCEREKGKNGAVFYITLPSGIRITPKTDMRCFRDYDCKRKTKLFVPSCGAANDTTCGLVDESNGELKCQDPTKKLTIYYSSDGKNFTLTNSSYACDPSSGSYINGTTNVPARASARCIGEARAVDPPTAAISERKIVTYIGIAFVSVIVVLAALFVILLFSMKSKKKLRKRQKNYWANLNRAERIAKCREDFGKALQAVNSEDIIIGLCLMEVMLETETEEGECWEEACKFLSRLRGTLIRVDNGLWHLLSRYLYLQAKQIIDKHGWRTQERITRNNQKGLIRAAAIRLLSFAVNENMNPETEELIASGYSNLGFRGIKQYPHCGLIWALVMHARAAKTKCNDKVKFPQHIDYTKFLSTLMDISGKSKLSLPKDDVIPEFGTLEEQAAFAIGGTPVFTHHMDRIAIYEMSKFNDLAILRSYFKGIMDCLWRISMQTVYTAFGVGTEDEAKKDKYMTEKEKERKMVVDKLVPEMKLSDFAMAGVRLLTYYGMPVGAKRLYLRFVEHNSDDELGQLILEQTAFEQATEKMKEELRAWFAKRTDKEELKTKPVYGTDNKIKLDSRVGDQPENGQSETGIDAATATKSKSDTKSNNQSSGGGSNSSDNAPAPTPNDAAAPAAPEAAAAPAATPTPNAAAATPATP